MLEVLNKIASLGIDIPKNNKDAEYVYKVSDGRELKITFKRPKKNIYSKAPVYFLIPGGGWKVEDRNGMLEFSKTSVNELLNCGFAVISIDYRVTMRDNVIMRDIIGDCFNALNYISYFSDIFMIDKQKIVLSGHSAGGHLALMLAYADSNCFTNDYAIESYYNIIAVAAMSAPTVLYDEDAPKTLGFENEKIFFGCDTEEERKISSPICHVTKKSPRTVLFAGTKDTLVFPVSSELLYEKLVSCNVKSEIVFSVGGGHCFEKKDSDITPSLSLEDIQNLIIKFALDSI